MGISPGVKARPVDLNLRRMEMQQRRQLFQGELRNGSSLRKLIGPTGPSISSIELTNRKLEKLQRNSVLPGIAPKYPFLVPKGKGRGSVYDMSHNYLGDIPLRGSDFHKEDFESMGNIIIEGLHTDNNGNLRIAEHPYIARRKYGRKEIEWAKFRNGILISYKIKGENEPRKMRLIYEVTGNNKLKLRDSHLNRSSNKYPHQLVTNLKLDENGKLTVGGRWRVNLGSEYKGHNVQWAELKNDLLVRFKLKGEIKPRNMSLVYEVTKEGKEILRDSFYGSYTQKDLEIYYKVVIRNHSLSGKGGLHIGNLTRFELGRNYNAIEIDRAELENGVLIRSVLAQGKELKFFVYRDDKGKPIRSIYCGERSYNHEKGNLFEAVCRLIYQEEYEEYNQPRELGGNKRSGVRPDFTCDSKVFADKHGYIIWADAKYSSEQGDIDDITIPEYLQALKEHAAKLSKELGKPIEYKLYILHLNGGNGVIRKEWANEPIYFVNVLEANRQRLEKSGRDYVVRYLEYLRGLKFYEGILEDELYPMQLKFDNGEFPWF